MYHCQLAARRLQIGLEAATKALLDAGITYDKVEAAFVGYCYGSYLSVRSHSAWLSEAPRQAIPQACSSLSPHVV